MSNKFRQVNVSKWPREFTAGIENGDTIELMKVQAIGTEHLVFLDYNTMDYYYYHAPTDGPYEWLMEWAEKVHDAVMFSPLDSHDPLSVHDAWVGASEYALAAATEEVKLELIT